MGYFSWMEYGSIIVLHNSMVECGDASSALPWVKAVLCPGKNGHKQDILLSWIGTQIPQIIHRETESFKLEKAKTGVHWCSGYVCFLAIWYKWPSWPGIHLYSSGWCFSCLHENSDLAVVIQILVMLCTTIKCFTCGCLKKTTFKLVQNAAEYYLELFCDHITYRLFFSSSLPICFQGQFKVLVIILNSEMALPEISGRSPAAMCFYLENQVLWAGLVPCVAASRSSMVGHIEWTFSVVALQERKSPFCCPPSPPSFCGPEM